MALVLFCVCCGANLFGPEGHRPCPKTFDGYHCNDAEARFLSPAALDRRCVGGRTKT